MDYNTIIGVDPGISSGGLAFIYPQSGEIVTCKVPILKIKKGKKQQTVIDISGLRQLLQKQIILPAIAFIEDVHSMPKQGVSSSFRFGECKGLLLGILVGLGASVQLFPPQQWKKKLGLSQDKQASLLKAKLLFPQLEISDDNVAEALLLAYFGKCHHTPTGIGSPNDGT